jgi:hypothetical protein
MKSVTVAMGIVLLLILRGMASADSRPNQHQERSDDNTTSAQQRQPIPMVPLSVQDSVSAALHDALAALHAEQEAHAKDNHSSYEPWYAPSVLIQIGLPIIGGFYTYFAWRQWTAIKEQTRLTGETLIADKRAFVTADTFFQFWELDRNTSLYNWRLSPRYRNTGSTPTKNLRSQVHCEVRNEPLPDRYPFVCDENAFGTGVIGPQSEMRGGSAPKGAAIAPPRHR